VTGALHILYVAAALARYLFLAKDGPIAALAVWVLLADSARFGLLPMFADSGSPGTLALIDCLWISWYVAHFWAASAYGERGKWLDTTSVLTLLATAAFALHYMQVERWMGPDALRDIWLAVAGCCWSCAALVKFMRAPAGIGPGIGMASSALSVVQVLNLSPARLSVVTVHVFWPAATVAILAGFAPMALRRFGGLLKRAMRP
jgi:hypothetical protein